MPDSRAILDKARSIVTRVKPDALEAERSLPIRAEVDHIRGLWEDPAARAAVLDHTPVSGASVGFGEPDRDWGTTVHMHVRLEAPLPDTAAQAFAGKVLRRLKALAETGEVPTTERNSSARDDAGEPTS